MIRFILLLPVRLVGVVFTIIGAFIDSANRRKYEKEKQQKRNAILEERIAKEQYKQFEKQKHEQIRLSKQAAIEKEKQERKQKQAEKEKALKEERLKVKQFKIDQAKSDIIHYEQQRREYLKLYNELQTQYENAETNIRKETYFRKLIAINQSIRDIDKKIEKCQFVSQTK